MIFVRYRVLDAVEALRVTDCHLEAVVTVAPRFREDIDDDIIHKPILVPDFSLAETDQGDENATVDISGRTGDVVLKNADCAENFEIDSGCMSEAEPGTVMVLDEEGKLRPSTTAYDRRVAGVVSGAGNCRPGIILDRQADRSGRRPIALVGKVFCKVDATSQPVPVGDWLTTSATPGHAMKATNRPQAFGAVLGKALRPLQEGCSLIPVLVALQ